MRFDEPIFAVFLLILVVGIRPLTWTWKKRVLWLASYLFYAAWQPAYVLLLVFSTAVDWFVARALARTEAPGPRKQLLGLSLLVNLGLLFTFKYLDFFVENVNRLWTAVGGAPISEPGLLLPVGISFFTFQTLSYTIDVYRRRLQPARSVVDYALYVSFFPQLVAGPIVRATEFLPQTEREPRGTAGQFLWGLQLVLLGLFQKSVMADVVFAPVADAAFASGVQLDFHSAWLGTLAFSGQIYCDFAGYSTCAIGTAMLFGFALPDNFRSPYAATGLSDFWRRWHITLSSWLRDYLYIPLGGNRRGQVRTYVHLMITMLLGGLWHGASWTFVVWGFLHGLGLALERRFRKREAASGPARWAAAAASFGFVCFTWVFFRAENLADALRMVEAMVGMSGAEAPLAFTRDESRLTLGCMAGLLGMHQLLRNRPWESVFQVLPTSTQALVVGAVATALWTLHGEDRAFIYFQF